MERIFAATSFLPMIYLSGNSLIRTTNPSITLFLLTWGIQIITSIHLFLYFPDPLTWSERIIYILAILGFSLRLWCYYVLGKFFLPSPHIRKDHKLVKTGPYRWLIHPSYTGQLLTFYCGLVFLITGGIEKILILLMAIFTVCGLNERMKIEEELMFLHFGDEYQKYLKERWRIIPFVW